MAGRERRSSCKGGVTRAHRGDDALVEPPNVVEVVHVEKGARAGQHKLQLPLDGRHLVLARAPRVGEEDVEAVRLGEGEFGPGAGGEADSADARAEGITDDDDEHEREDAKGEEEDDGARLEG